MHVLCKRHMYVGPQIVSPQAVGSQNVATQYTVGSQMVVTSTMPLNHVVQRPFASRMYFLIGSLLLCEPLEIHDVFP